MVYSNLKNGWTACISHSVTSFGCETAEEAHLMIVLHSSMYLEICSMGVGGGVGGKVEVQDMGGKGAAGCD